MATRAMKTEFRILGQQVRQPSTQLDTFPTPLSVTLVELETCEFTSLCPVTGQPDFSRITITYSPKEKCLESKSLKLYLWTFREEGHFCEALSSIIVHEVARVLEPHWCKVMIVQNVRGGIAITSTAVWEEA